MVIVLPVDLIASAKAWPSDNVNPPSIRTASDGPDTKTGAIKAVFPDREVPPTQAVLVCKRHFGSDKGGNASGCSQFEGCSTVHFDC